MLNTHILTLHCSHPSLTGRTRLPKTYSCGDRRGTEYQLIQHHVHHKVVVNVSSHDVVMIYAAGLISYRVHMHGVHVYRGWVGGNPSSRSLVGRKSFLQCSPPPVPTLNVVTVDHDLVYGQPLAHNAHNAIRRPECGC